MPGPDPTPGGFGGFRSLFDPRTLVLLAIIVVLGGAIAYLLWTR